MVMRDEAITPIDFIGHNRCPYCGSYLLGVDSEMFYFSYDSRGFPLTNDVGYFRCCAICPPCQKEFPLIRTGDRYAITSDVLKTIASVKGQRKREKT